MAYENTTFPGIPEDHDTALYPYMVVLMEYELGATDWYHVTMFYSSVPFTHDTTTGAITNTEGVSRSRVYSMDDQIWSVEVYGTGAPNLIAGKHGMIYQRIWSDHDVLSDDSTVFIPADGVTHEVWKGLKSWMIGAVLGVAWPKMPQVKADTDVSAQQ